MKPVQMVDLYGQYIARKTEFDEALSSVISSSKFIQGPEVLSFQKELAEYLGVKHVVTCGNGTDALTIALWALEEPKRTPSGTIDAQRPPIFRAFRNRNGPQNFNRAEITENKTVFFPIK